MWKDILAHGPGAAVLLGAPRPPVGMGALLLVAVFVAGRAVSLFRVEPAPSAGRARPVTGAQRVERRYLLTVTDEKVAGSM